MASAIDRPTIRPALSFDPNTDASELKKAMKGMGTNEKLIVQVLGRRTSSQRQQICQTYATLFGKDLVEELKKELGGQFEKAILALLTPLPKYLAQELNRSMKGVGTKENALIEVVCSKDNKSLLEIKSAYLELFGNTLEKDIKGETSGDFQRILEMIITAKRDEHTCDRAIAQSLAQSLYKAGEKKKFGTDEAEFTRIVSTYSFPMLRIVFEEYEKISGNPFEHAIKSELSGDYGNAVTAIYSCVSNKEAYFATLLNDAMKGLGTRNDALLRVIITRSEIDLGNIKDEFQKLFGKKLEDAVASETSGDFTKILLALMQG